MAEEFTTGYLITALLTLVICLFGLVGNLLCLLVLFHKDMTLSSYTYILLGLTFSDLGLLILSTLRTLSNLNLFDLSDNPQLQTFIFFWDWIATSGTKYYTVAISLERLFVVTFPLKTHLWLTLARAKMCAVGVLLFVVCLSTFSYIYVNYIDATSFHIYVAVVFHFTPFFTVLVLNIFVFLALKKYTKLRKSLTQTERSEESVTRMLFAVVVVFGICYSFEFVRRIMNFAWKDYMAAYKYYDYNINHLADIFYVLNSSVNFLIYCLLGQSFRSVFYKIMGKHCAPCVECFGGERGSSKKVVSGVSSTTSESRQTELSKSSESDLNEI